MREDLDALLRETTLVTLALAIGFGWSLYQLAHGVAVFVDQLFLHLPPGDFGSNVGGPLSWVVGNRLLSFDELVVGLVELAVVAVAAVLVRRRRVSASSGAA